MDNNKQNNPDHSDDLKLPDMEASWQKMKDMLEKKEKERKPVFFLWRYAGLALLLLLTGGISWYVISHQDDDENRNLVDQAINETKTEKKTSKEISNQNKPEISEEKAADHDQSTQLQTNINADSSSKTNGSYSIGNNKIPDDKFNTTQSNSSTTLITSTKKRKQKINPTRSKEDAEQLILIASTKDAPDSLTIAKDAINEKDKIQNISNASDTATAKAGVEKLKQDTVQDTKAITDLNSKDKNLVKQINKKKSPFIFSGGIGLHQQIPSNNAGENVLLDYIPSGYLKMEKNQKWFLQGEFRYSAAQSFREFSYYRQTRLIDSGKIVSTTSYNLKKTYYHQLPVSFNYYLSPSWSIGTGIIYNIFDKAVIEKEVTRFDIITLQQTSSKELLKMDQFTDSFLYKTQVQLLFQTEYHWKRFTFGVRYTADLQPYIRFTRPNGELSSKKNQAIQAMIRFRLW